jgi:hypothetical protein
MKWFILLPALLLLLGEPEQAGVPTTNILVALIIASPGLAASYISWKNGRRADRIADERAAAEAQAKKDIDEAARAVKMVKVQLEETTDRADAKLDVIHKLVNSGLEIHLGAEAVALREVADLKKKMGMDSGAAEAAAEKAEKLLAEHKAKQAEIDAGGGVTTTTTTTTKKG